MAGVELRGLEKTFGAQHILQGIDLEIPDGGFVVVVGPSGCGKSTLLRIIAGLEEPSAGQLLINGDDARGTSPAQRGVAMVFQSYALYPHLDVFENMAFPLRIAKKSQAEVAAAVEKVAALLGIESLLSRRPRELSGGQRQRVAIGRAIIRQPRILLLDEPLSNLDAGLRTHMRLEFARLHRELKATTIYVTHDQVEAMTLADRIVVLNAGRVEQVGTPLDIYHAPINLFVAGFLGAPRMNFMAGEVTAVARGGVTVRLGNGADIRAALGGGARARVGDAVTVGVRPDSLHRKVSRGDNALAFEIDIVETLGGSLSLHGLLTGTEAPFTALLPASERVVAHEMLRLGFRPEDAYLFDVEGQAFPRKLTIDA